jgi:hypothetical protein
MGIKKDAFFRDMVRVVTAQQQAVQREWAEVVREVGPDVIGAVNLVWGNRQRFPHIGRDRFSMDRVKELLSFASATIERTEQLPEYILRYLKSKYASFFQITVTDERNIKQLLAQNAGTENIIKALYEYLNKTLIKREYDKIYVTDVHKRRLASQKNPVFVYSVVLKYLDSLDRGF